MNISYSRLFVKDINEIAEYITNEFCNPLAADKLKKEIFNEVDRLSDSPFLGESLPPSYRINNQDLRRLVVKKHIIIYRVTDQIIAERVLYGRRDWMNILSSGGQNL